MDILVLIGSVLGAIVGYIIKARIEEVRRINEGIYEKRRDLYIEILEPYIKLFTTMGKGNKEKNFEIIVNDMKSYEYRKKAFELNLFGSDDVVKAMNAYWKYLYQQESIEKADSDKKGGYELLSLFGDLLVEVRKSLGNKNTQLNNVDMLQFVIKDIDKLKSI